MLTCGWKQYKHSKCVVFFSTTACLVRSKCGDRCLHCYYHMHHCTMSYCSWTWEHFFIIHATQVTLQTLWWQSSFPPQSHKTTGSLREPHCSASLVNKPLPLQLYYMPPDHLLRQCCIEFCTLQVTIIFVVWNIQLDIHVCMYPIWYHMQFLEHSWVSGYEDQDYVCLYLVSLVTKLLHYKQS